MTTPTSGHPNGGYTLWRVAFVGLMIVFLLYVGSQTIFKAKADNSGPGASNPPAAPATPAPGGNNPSAAPSGNPGKVKVFVPGNGNLQGAIDQFNKNHDALAFCKAMADVIGGPVEKWWGTQNPDGSSVPNSCVLREADDSDGVPGWPVTLPMGTNSHIWLYDCNLPNNCHATVTATGQGTVQGQMLASRMTVYFVDGAYSASHRGMWTFGQLSGSDRDSACGWVSIGTTVNICSNPGGSTSAGNSSSSGNSGSNSCSVSQIQKDLGVSGGNWNAVGQNGGHYKGPSVKFSVPNGYVVDSPDGRKSSGQSVNAGEFTAYCGA